MAAIPQDVVATLDMTAMLAAATNAASVVNALADRKGSEMPHSRLSHDESVLYDAAVVLLQQQFASVLETIKEQRQAAK